MFDSVTSHSTKINHLNINNSYIDYGYNYQVNIEANYLNPFINKNVKGKKLNVKVFDSNNNNIKEFNMTTDENGNAQEFITELPLGVYILKTSFNGDNFFNPSFREDNFTVKKAFDNNTNSNSFKVNVNYIEPKPAYPESKPTESKPAEPIAIDDGPNWTRLHYITDDKNIIRQELDYDCSCNSIQLAYYGITGILVDEIEIVNYVYGDNPGGGANASMIQDGIDGLNNKYNTNVHIKWMNTTEIGGLDGVATLYSSGGYTVFQNLPGHFQVIRGVNTKNKLLTIYSSLNSTTNTNGMYDNEPGVFEWSYDRNYDLINRQTWAAWDVLK
jgi:hypothetical protein